MHFIMTGRLYPHCLSHPHASSSPLLFYSRNKLLASPKAELPLSTTNCLPNLQNMKFMNLPKECITCRLPKFSLDHSSCVDVTLCSVSLVDNFIWNRSAFQWGSDHYPILIIFLCSSPTAVALFMAIWPSRLDPVLADYRNTLFALTGFSHTSGSISNF